MAIDMDSILAGVKEGIAKNNPPAPAPRPARPVKPAAAKPATQAEENDEDEDQGEAAAEEQPTGADGKPAKKYLHNFSPSFKKKYGARPEEKAEEEEAT